MDEAGGLVSRNCYFLLLSDYEPAKEGSLFILQQKLPSYFSNITNIENRSEILTIPNSRLKELTSSEASLLLPNTPEERIDIIRDQEWLVEGRHIDRGSIVTVKDGEDPNRILRGTVCYKGDLPEKKGTFFGVELVPEFEGRGTSDGEYRKQRFFRCGRNCAVFAKLWRIRIYKGLSIEDRVIWFSDNGPEKGTVQWIGRLPDTKSDTVTVGVEFDNPIGSGTGKYKGQQLFTARKGHASLVPIAGLVKDEEESDFNAVGQFSGHFSQGPSMSGNVMACPTSLSNSPQGSPIPYRKFGSLQQEVLQTDYEHSMRIGSRVQVNVGDMRYGVVKWLEPIAPGKIIAGLEMDDCDVTCYTDGTFQGRKVFECQPNRSFFVYLSKCQPDGRYKKGN